jgi:cupin 2 domain-containing protein
VEALAVTPAVTGRLRPSADAPPTGERSVEIAQLGGVVVEHILSGALRAPVDYDQDHDEWVVLLNGEATLDVGGETLDLNVGDWVLLRAHVRHRLLETVRGTTWLAIHAAPPARPEDA